MNLIATSGAVVDVLDNKVFVFVFGKNKPEDDVWKAWAAFLRTVKDLGSVTNLIITDGGGPSAEQRKPIMEEFGDVFKHTRTSVVSDSMVVRFIVASFSLRNSEIKLFAPDGILAAVDFIGSTRTEGGMIFEHLRKISESSKPRFSSLSKCLAEIGPRFQASR